MIYAIVLGLLYGIVPVTGLPAFASFVVTQFLNASLWFRYQGIDPDEHDDPENPLQNEGVGPSVSLFLLVWILTYSSVQF